MKTIKEGDYIYLMDNKPHPELDWYKTNNTFDWRWEAIEQFPMRVENPPTVGDYAALIIRPLSAAILTWLAVHTVAWVVAGFRTGSV